MVTHMFVHVLLVFLYITGATPAFANSVSFKCREKERQALLHLKDKLIDDYGRLSSWTASKDCCKWEGLRCDNQTAHVTVLDLRNPIDATNRPLRGMLSSSLLELKHLNYLDLSFNDFTTSQIPEFIGSLSNLKYLNFSNAQFYGSIPHQIGNLSQLQFLDFRYLFSNSENLDWLSNLRSLRYLDLSGVDLHNATNWLQAVGNLPSLLQLNLIGCNLPQILAPPFSLVNTSTSLAILDLTQNHLSSSSLFTWLFNFSSSFTHVELKFNILQGNIPDAFGGMTNLEYLGLSANHLDGGIPRSFGNLSNLKSLDLSAAILSGQLPELMRNLSGNINTSKLKYLNLGYNKISGLFPDISRFSALTELKLGGNQLSGFSVECCSQHMNLVYLDLSGNQISGPLPDFANFPYLREIHFANNQFNGTLPETIGRLSHLKLLSLRSNHLEGIASEIHFSKLSQLRTLSLSFNSLLVLNFSSIWFPPFQLTLLKLSSVNLGPWFPKWLLTQRNITYLDISDTGISGSIPTWFLNILPNITFLNLSHNQINGMLPDLSTKFPAYPTIDLSYNNLTGPLPSLPTDILTLDLSENRLSGSISVLCNSGVFLTFLDLSNNHLFGELPSCLTNWTQLRILNLADNHLLGEVPHYIGSLTLLQALHLRNNSFTGEIPASLRNCAQLKIIDLGGNKFSGKIPPWIGDSLPDLVLLSLRSNELHGSIPSNLCRLTSIQILDLSMNKISGTIPKCFDNLTAMAQEGSSMPVISFRRMRYDLYEDDDDVEAYSDSAFILWKGVEVEYRSTLGLVISMDLSNNNLTGEIPSEISTLIGLIGLNLSTNSLSGSIPPGLGNLRLLNFLDLSKNQLSGIIPNKLSELSHLGVFNLSYNNLSGRIPSTLHLDTFDSTSYIGNSELCGTPLPKPCPGDEVPSEPNWKDHNGHINDEDEEDKFIVIDMGFYVSLALGFIFGFWGVYGTLALKPTWGYKFYSMIVDRFLYH